MAPATSAAIPAQRQADGIALNFCRAGLTWA